MFSARKCYTSSCQWLKPLQRERANEFKQRQIKSGLHQYFQRLVTYSRWKPRWTRTRKHSCLLRNVKEFTKTTPWDEAPGAMCHVKGPCRVRHTISSHDAENCRNSSLQSKLNLRNVRVPGCKGHSQNVLLQKIGSPTAHLKWHTCTVRSKDFTPQRLSFLCILENWRNPHHRNFSWKWSNLVETGQGIPQNHHLCIKWATGRTEDDDPTNHHF